MDRRHFFSQLGLIGLGVFFAWVVNETFLNRHADRRFTLYSTIRELRKDMPRSEVETIISRHETPFIRKHLEENKVLLSVHLGAHDYLYLEIEFLDGKLAKAYFRGEDNPWDVPRDAPSTIE